MLELWAAVSAADVLSRYTKWGNFLPPPLGHLCIPGPAFSLFSSWWIQFPFNIQIRHYFYQEASRNILSLGKVPLLWYAAGSVYPCLHLLACQAHSRNSINIKRPTSLTGDGMKLFIGTSLWAVNQTDWFFVFFCDFHMWIKVDGLRSKFGLSAVSLANHIFLISCIDGMICHACYSVTACCRV